MVVVVWAMFVIQASIVSFLLDRVSAAGHFICFWSGKVHTVGHFTQIVFDRVPAAGHFILLLVW